jgi:hypothetical protein
MGTSVRRSYVATRTVAIRHALLFLLPAFSPALPAKVIPFNMGNYGGSKMHCKSGTAATQLFS